MSLFKIVLLMGCMTFAACLKCSYSGCANQVKDGNEICRLYGYNHHTGLTTNDNCPLNKKKAHCCNVVPSWHGCKWSKCYGLSYTPGYICESEFGSELQANGNKVRCPELRFTKFECCPHNSALEA